MTPLGFERSGGDYGGPVSATPVEQPEALDIIVELRSYGLELHNTAVPSSECPGCQFHDALDALLARLEAAEGEGARLRGLMKQVLYECEVPDYEADLRYRIRDLLDEVPS